jgi:nicotinamidase-related amidase
VDEKAIAYYKGIGIGKRMGFGSSPSILVIDMQNGFTDPRYPLAASLDDEINHTNEVLVAAKRRKVPVIFTVIAYDGSGLDGGRYFEKIPNLKMLVKGTRLVELDSRLTRQPEDVVIEKRYPSAFFGTDLLDLLRRFKTDTTIICGCVTSSCVRATALDSMQHGFYTVVVRECVGDRLPGPHESSLFDLDTKFADVVGRTEVLAYLDGLAGAK